MIMTCKECENLMSEFLDETLREDRIDGFLRHVEDCEECREELSIRILVSEGLPSLEKETTFNLNEAMKSRISGGRKKTELVKKLWISVRVGSCMCLAAAAVLLYLAFTLGL